MISSRTLRSELDGFIDQFDYAGLRPNDPIAFPHRFEHQTDQEVVGLLAALLAYGRADLIARAMESILQRVGPHPAQTLMGDTEASARNRFDGFVYRVTRGVDIARLWCGLGQLLRKTGTLGAAFHQFDEPAVSDLRPALNGVRKFIIDNTPTFEDRRGFYHLLCNPYGGSACKRYCMFLRWMVRGPDTVDFGHWSDLGTHRLVMPLDTHVHRIGRYIGLTHRNQADWRTAVDITSALKAFDDSDPLRYDFAIAHMGISGSCPSRRVDSICQDCTIRRICTLPDHP